MIFPLSVVIRQCQSVRHMPGIGSQCVGILSGKKPHEHLYAGLSSAKSDDGAVWVSVAFPLFIGFPSQYII